MVRLIVSDDGGLWRGFSFPRPATLADTLRHLTDQAVTVEVYSSGPWLNERRALIPQTPASSYDLIARTGLDPQAIVTVGFGADSATIPVSKLRASVLEATLNHLPAMATAGGCDVRTLVADPDRLEFRVTFREAGARDAITLGVESGQVGTVTEVTAGDVSTQEVQTIKLEQKVATTISTATTAVAATLRNPDTGVWTVTIDERATGGSWKLTIGATATTPIDHDATAQQVLDAVVTAAGDSNWSVTGDWRRGFLIRDDSGTPPTITLSDVLQGWSGRSGILDLRALKTASDRSRQPLILQIITGGGLLVYNGEVITYNGEPIEYN